MFVWLVRNMFSVVAGASVRKKYQLWEVSQRWPSLIVSYLKQWLWDSMTSIWDSNSTMIPMVRTTKDIQTPWPVQLFTDENATVQKGFERGSNPRHTADLFDQHQSGWLEGSAESAHDRHTPYKKEPGDHASYLASQLHKHFIYHVMENSHCVWRSAGWLSCATIAVSPFYK